MNWGSNVPADVQIERKVDEVIAGGSVLPRWGWPVPAPYNGATGQERIYVWQQNRIGQMLGLMPKHEICSACQSNKAVQNHGEIYFRPFALEPVCRSCHARIHRRYSSPVTWNAFLNEKAPKGSWLHALPMKPISRENALLIAERPEIFTALANYSEALRAGKLV